MNGIYTVSIIFLLFIIYNYLYAYEGFETTAYTSSINSLLTGNKWVNPQTFDNDVTINGSLVLKKEINADVVVKSDKKICIGTSCITEEHLKMLLGKQNIYIHKPNHGNNYLGLDSIGITSKFGSDPSEKKMRYGAWRMNYKPVDGNETIIKSDCKTFDKDGYLTCLNTYNDTFL